MIQPRSAPFPKKSSLPWVGPTTFHIHCTRQLAVLSYQCILASWENHSHKVKHLKQVNNYVPIYFAPPSQLSVLPSNACCCSSACFPPPSTGSRYAAGAYPCSSSDITIHHPRDTQEWDMVTGTLAVHRLRDTRGTVSRPGAGPVSQWSIWTDCGGSVGDGLLMLLMAGGARASTLIACPLLSLFNMHCRPPSHSQLYTSRTIYTAQLAEVDITTDLVYSKRVKGLLNQISISDFKVFLANVHVYMEQGS